MNYAVKFPVDAALPAAAEAAGQWVVRQWTSPLTRQPVRQQPQPQPLYGTLTTHRTRTALFTDCAPFTHFFFFFFNFSSPVKFFESHLRSKTFTYGSRLWGQVVVSLGETSLCCCCCWKVRLFITLLSGWSLKPFKGLTGNRFISKIRNSELIFPLILSLFEICISCHLEHPHVCLSLPNVIQQELKYTE